MHQKSFAFHLAFVARYVLCVTEGIIFTGSICY